jgi:hypothetical protein
MAEFLSPKKRQHTAAVEAHLAGASLEEVGLQAVACTTPGCQARDFWQEGDKRRERDARKYIGNHKKHSRA